jgi:hypothetical protein
MASLGTLAVNIVARTEKFTAGISKTLSQTDRLNNRMGSLTKSVGAYVAAGLSAAAVTNKMQSAFERADAVGKLSDQLGLMPEKLTGLQHAADLSGVATNTLNASLSRVNIRIAEAAQGSGVATGALIELGLSAKTLNNLPLDDKFGMIADAISRVPNPADRARLATDLFGKSGTALVSVLELGSKGLHEATADAVALGQTLDRQTILKLEETNDAISRMTKSFDGLFTQMAGDWAPQLTEFADRMTQLSVETRKLTNPGKGEEGSFLGLMEGLGFQRTESGIFNWFVPKDGLPGRSQAEIDASIEKVNNQIGTVLARQVEKGASLIVNKIATQINLADAFEQRTRNQTFWNALQGKNLFGKPNKLRTTKESPVDKMLRDWGASAMSGLGSVGGAMRDAKRGANDAIWSDALNRLTFGALGERLNVAKGGQRNTLSDAAPRGGLAFAETGSVASYQQRAAIRNQSDRNQEMKSVAKNTFNAATGINKLVTLLGNAPVLAPANIGG